MAGRPFPRFSRRLLATACAAALIGGPFAPASAAVPANILRNAAGHRQPVESLSLPNGGTAVIYADGETETTTKQGDGDLRILPIAKPYDDITAGNGLPDKRQLAFELAKTAHDHPFVEGRVIVVFRSGVSQAHDKVVVSSAALKSMRQAGPARTSAAVPFGYTNDLSVNRLLTRMGVSAGSRLFSAVNRATLSSMSAAVAGSARPTGLNLANAYRLQLTAMPVRQAVTALLKLPAVAYASPDWIVTPLHAQPVSLKPGIISAANSRARLQRASVFGSKSVTASLPSNYAISSSAQSLLNAPSMNAAAAFDEIKTKFHQLPGQGEIITNVSLGDLDDSSDVTTPNDPCAGAVSIFGPTTTVIGGQRYIDWPSMPLIAAYSADVNGNVSGSAPVCWVDPYLVEVGLDFSVMAPLPHDSQRAGEIGSGLTDLLGIAPGATYRLVVPQTLQDPGNSDIVAALLAAANQTPRPNVITASLGFGFDALGFSGRYLEDDPLTQAVIASIVNNYNIVVCISSGDGTRLFTNPAIGPSGGSTPTEVVSNGGTPSDLNDVAQSTAPSLDFDSGSIDVGGTTLDDIFAAPPQNPMFAKIASQHAFPETRWTGFTSFSSGFGSRVNVSAPSDNVLSFDLSGSNFDSVNVVLNGGTSASAPETAAAAAVALQIARLTGHPFRNALDVRSFLETSGTPVPAVSQSDVDNHIGPQVDVGKIVEKLLAAGGKPVQPGVPRVAIEQRRNYGQLDGAILTDTDPTNIDLEGPISIADGTNTDRNEKAWITMAPDWEGLPPNADFKLTVVGHDRVPLATSRWARLLPEQILSTAGLPLVSPNSRTIQLRYRAIKGAHVYAETTFPLTFGPAEATTRAVLAPVVPSVVRGNTIPVSYDLRNARNVANPTLVVSSAGRVDPATGIFFYPAFSLPLTSLQGTIQVPVTALQGGGVYGVGIAFGTVNGQPLYSDFAFTRVSPTASDHRPSAPLIAPDSITLPGHFLQLDYGGKFSLTWDVRNVPAATGALLEISAPGPTFENNFNTFNNPNGSKPDKNGVDLGSVSTIPLSGTKGTMTLDGVSAGLVPSFFNTLRVIPTAGGRVVGEAGDVSTISMNGVVAADGGTVFNGFGINRDGDDGFLTSFGFNGQTLFGSVETFDQTTNKITNIADSWSTPNGVGPYVFFEALGGGVYTGDVATYWRLSEDPFNGPLPSTLKTLNPTSSGTIGNDVTLPATASPAMLLAFGAPDYKDDNAAFLGYGWNPATYRSDGKWYAFQANVPANSTGAAYDVTPNVIDSSCPGRSNYRAFTANTTTNVALMAASCGNLELLNFGTGAITTIKGLGSGHPGGLGVDTSTNIAAMTTQDDAGLTVFDLNAGTAKEVFLPGANTPFGTSVGVDPLHHLFLVLQRLAGNAQNNNNLSAILVYDENGNLVSRHDTFRIGRTSGFRGQTLPQLKPSNRSGYVPGAQADQLQPFRY